MSSRLFGKKNYSDTYLLNKLFLFEKSLGSCAPQVHKEPRVSDVNMKHPFFQIVERGLDTFERAVLNLEYEAFVNEITTDVTKELERDQELIILKTQQQPGLLTDSGDFILAFQHHHTTPLTFKLVINKSDIFSISIAPNKIEWICKGLPINLRIRATSVALTCFDPITQRELDGVDIDIYYGLVPMDVRKFFTRSYFSMDTQEPKCVYAGYEHVATMLSKIITFQTDYFSERPSFFQRELKNDSSRLVLDLFFFQFVRQNVKWFPRCTGSDQIILAMLGVSSTKHRRRLHYWVGPDTCSF